MRSNPHRRRPVPGFHLLLTAFLGLLLTGCSDQKSPSSPSGSIAFLPARTAPAPVANTPLNALSLFAWCWNNRGLERYPGLFPEDYLFVCGMADSAGNVFRNEVTGREDEIAIFRGVMNGTATLPPATRVSVQFDRDPFTLADPRPGKNPRWHRLVATSIHFTVVALGNTYRGGGSEVIYFVRGDSALIPQDLLERGAPPDSTRWLIERWEEHSGPPQAPIASGADQPSDGTAPAVRAVALARNGPLRPLSWCELRAMYR